MIARGGSPDRRRAVAEAVSELEAMARRKRPRPTRWEARALLVPLGELLLEGDDEGLDGLAGRARAATAGYSERFAAAVTEELQLACAEYVTSVDERYLEMPDYDFAYTSAARTRLEARLAACEHLGLAVPDGLREQIADADRVYAPHEERHRRSG